MLNIQDEFMWKTLFSMLFFPNIGKIRLWAMGLVNILLMACHKVAPSSLANGWW